MGILRDTHVYTGFILSGRYVFKRCYYYRRDTAKEDMRRQGKRSPEPQRQYEAALNRRSHPCFAVLDADLSVASVEARLADVFATVGLSLENGSLPDEVVAAVRHLLAAPPQQSRSVIVRDLLLRATALSGRSGQRVALSVEPVRRRDRLNNAPSRFGLSEREQQVLSLMLEGREAREIAQRLEVAQSTVAEYLKRLYIKVGAANRNEMLARVFDTSADLSS